MIDAFRLPLKVCPFCGSNKTEICESTVSCYAEDGIIKTKTYIWIECTGCEASGPRIEKGVDDTEAIFEASKIWNKRWK